MSLSRRTSRSSSIDSSNASEGWRRTAPICHASKTTAPGPETEASRYAGRHNVAISWGRFDTRTVVLIPIAMAINIVLGQTVASVLKVPVYMDSIGTILVGVLAGPIPGLVTGVLTNLVWTYVIPAPFHSDFAAPFAVVAAWIGLFSGLAAQWGFFRSRPNASWGKIAGAAILVILVLGGIGYYGFLPFYTDGSFTFFGDTSGAS